MSVRTADRLHLQGFELECIVGVRPPERKRPQRVRLDLTLGLDLSGAGRSGRISHTIDYALVAEEVQTLLRFRAYRLVEMATEELSAMLFAATASKRYWRQRAFRFCSECCSAILSAGEPL